MDSMKILAKITTLKGNHECHSHTHTHTPPKKNKKQAKKNPPNEFHVPMLTLKWLPKPLQCREQITCAFVLMHPKLDITEHRNG